MESFSNSCRLCLWKGDKMLPIFTSPDDDETASKIRKCLPLDVRWEDSLPKGICASCLYKVEMLFEFHCSAVRVDSLLRKYLASEIKDFAIKEQQLNNSGYQVTGVHTMRSVAIGTEDEYLQSTRIRECRESRSETEPIIARVRVRTPYDMNEVNSVGTSPMVLLPLRQSDPKGDDGCTTAVSSLAYRSDSAQGMDTASSHTVGVTEHSTANSNVLPLSVTNGTSRYQEETSGQPEQGARRSSQGEASVTGRPKSSGNGMQNDLSASRSCACGDDDEVVVLAEYQKPPQPYRRCKTPIPFDSFSNSVSTLASISTSTSTLQGDCSTGPHRKTQRLCARHQEYLRRQQEKQQQQQQQQQQGLPRQETQQGADQVPLRASEQAPAANTSSAGPTSCDAPRQVHWDHMRQAARDYSSGGGTGHAVAKTSSNSTQPEEHEQPHAQSRLTGGATSSTARGASSELSGNTNRPGHLEHVCRVASPKHEAATTETGGAPLSSSAECKSSVPEPQDRLRQMTPVQPQGTTADSSRTKSCGSGLSSAGALPPSAATASVPPPAAPPPPVAPLSAPVLTATVPPLSPATTPVPPPPSSTTLPKDPVLTSSTLPPEIPKTTESAATSSVTQSTVASHSARAATHSPSPGRFPSGGHSPSSSTAQKRSSSRSRSRTNSKSPSGRGGRSSESPVSAAVSRPTPPPTPSTPFATQASPQLAPLTTSITWPLSGAPTPSPALLRVSPQPQQQGTGHQRVIFSTRSSAQPENQLIQGKLQDGVFKIPAFLLVANASFHPATQCEQQGSVSPGLHTISPGTATTNLSAQSLPSPNLQNPNVPKEEEQKQQYKQTGSQGDSIDQLIAASALVSPPRGATRPEQQVNKPGEVQEKSPGQVAATHFPTAPPHSCPQPKQHDTKSRDQCEREKSGQQVPCDKPTGKTGRQPAASSVDTENKGGSAKTGQTLSVADQQLTATPQSSKRKKEHRSHSAVAELSATPAKAVAASPTPEQPKKIKQKLGTADSQTERSLLKSPEPVPSVVKSSTEIAEKMKQTPQVSESQLHGGNVEQHQATKAPALQNSDVSQKWKKKKKKKKEKEEEGSRHRSTDKCQQEQLPHKRKHPSRNSQQLGDPPSKRASTPSAQQSQIDSLLCTKKQKRGHENMNPCPVSPKRSCGANESASVRGGKSDYTMKAEGGDCESSQQQQQQQQPVAVGDSELRT